MDEENFAHEGAHPPMTMPRPLKSGAPSDSTSVG
jgi:hypothetical protein